MMKLLFLLAIINYKIETGNQEDSHMEFLYATELSIPLFQILLLLVLGTLSLLFGKVKLALLTNYIFALYWGYFLNRDLLLESMVKTEYFTLIYFGIGLIIVVLAIVGFMAHKE